MSSKKSKHRLIALAAVAAAMVACLALVGTNVVSASQLHKTWDNIFGSSKVGPQADGSYLLPSNQWISPIGKRIQINDGRLVSSTLSPAIGGKPAGTYLAALSWEDFTGFVTIIDVKTGKIVQQVGTGQTASDPSLGDGTVGPDGPFYSPDGKWLWVPQSADVVRFAVNADGTVSVAAGDQAPARWSRRRPAAGRHGALRRRQQALRGTERLQHARRDRQPERHHPHAGSNQIPVGNAPRQVVFVGNQAFVSNEGGPAGDLERLHEPLRRHRDRRRSPDGRRGHRHGLGRRPDHGEADRLDLASASSRRRSTSTAPRCLSPTPTMTAYRSSTRPPTRSRRPSTSTPCRTRVSAATPTRSAWPTRLTFW